MDSANTNRYWMFGLFVATSIIFLSYIVVHNSGVSFAKSYAIHFAYGIINVSKFEISEGSDHSLSAKSTNVEISKNNVLVHDNDVQPRLVDESELVVSKISFSQPGEKQSDQKVSNLFCHFLGVRSCFYHQSYHGISAYHKYLVPKDLTIGGHGSKKKAFWPNNVANPHGK